MAYRKIAAEFVLGRPVCHRLARLEVPGPNGTMLRKRIPLTLEDALHPLEGDVLPMSRLHFRILQYLFNVFGSKLVGDPSMGVFSDMSVYWDHPLFGSSLSRRLRDSRDPQTTGLLCELL